MYAVIQQVGYGSRMFTQGRQRVPKLWLLVAFWRSQADFDAGEPEVLVEDFLLAHRALKRMPDTSLVPFDVVADVVRIIAQYGVRALAKNRTGHRFAMANKARGPVVDPEGTMNRPEVVALKDRAITEVDAV